MPSGAVAVVADGGVDAEAGDVGAGDNGGDKGNKQHGDAHGEGSEGDGLIAACWAIEGGAEVATGSSS
jgi:hypothetical protein